MKFFILKDKIKEKEREKGKISNLIAIFKIMSKILVINKYNKIEEKDFDLGRFCLKDFLYDTLRGEFITLNKNINSVECIFFYNSKNTYEDLFLDNSMEENKVVIVKSDLLNGYIDVMGNYVCYYGFSAIEVLEIKKHIVMEKNKFLHINNKMEEKCIIYIDSYSKIKEILINKYNETIKELINNILGDKPFTFSFKINNLECSIWFNNNKEDRINKSALNILDIGYIKGDFILTKYCKSYEYIVGEGCYTLDDGFNSGEKDLVLNYIKNN